VIEWGRRGKIVMLDVSFLLHRATSSLPVVRHAKYDPTVAAPTQKYDAVR
jgi:hypothetical protein